MKKIGFVILGLLLALNTFAHPMPNSVLALSVHTKNITCNLQLPLKELEDAVPFDVNDPHLLQKHGKDLLQYLQNHFHIQGNTKHPWRIDIGKMALAETQQDATGLYKELQIAILITPYPQDNIRQFTLHYDAIMHQVVTHKTLITIQQDWENGKIADTDTEIGVIAADINTNKVFPFKVNLSQGSNWKGFTAMLSLGMKHIAEGTDHLLFLLVLLLSAPLIATQRKWNHAGSTTYSLRNILKIATAFTIGHSITLILGALGLVHLPAKPVEMLIALSIMVTALHAITPIFPKKESYLAAGFGLIHGLAFASILYNLHLENHRLILSLLAFNIGIELLQLIVILMVMPWLLLLSNFRIYDYVRVIGGILASIAAIAWLLERYTEHSNWISLRLQNSSQIAPWLIAALATFSIIFRLVYRKK